MNKKYEDETYCMNCQEYYGDLDEYCPCCGDDLVNPADVAEIQWEAYRDRLFDEGKYGTDD